MVVRNINVKRGTLRQVILMAFCTVSTLKSAAMASVSSPALLVERQFNAAATSPRFVCVVTSKSLAGRILFKCWTKPVWTTCRGFGNMEDGKS